MISTDGRSAAKEWPSVVEAEQLKATVNRHITNVSKAHAYGKGENVDQYVQQHKLDHGNRLDQARQCGRSDPAADNLSSAST